MASLQKLLGEFSLNITGILIRRGNVDTDTLTGKTTCGQKDDRLQAEQREAWGSACLAGTSSTDTSDFSLQIIETVNFYCLSHPAGGTLSVVTLES